MNRLLRALGRWNARLEARNANKALRVQREARRLQQARHELREDRRRGRP